MQNNIFIAVMGITPQILTETLFYYSVKKNIGFNEIHIITTTVGKEIIDQEIIGKSRFIEMCKDYNIPYENMPQPIIHLIKSENDTPLEDVRNLKDNDSAAHNIMQFIKEKTAADQNVLFCSLAGGRKTMSAYMALALNFFGRKQDKLSHVLVSPQKYELEKTFFYPEPENKDIKIEVAEIPFVRLRDKLDEVFGIENLDFADLVKLTSLSETELEKEIKTSIKSEANELNVRFEDKSYNIRFSNKQWIIYNYFYNCTKPVQLEKIETILKQEYLDLKYGDSPLKPTVNNKKSEGKFDPESLEKAISEINIKIIEKNIPVLCQPFLKIVSKEKAYFLKLSPKYRN